MDPSSRTILSEVISKKAQTEFEALRKDWRREHSKRLIDFIQQFEYQFDIGNGDKIVIQEDFETLGTRVWDTSVMMSKFFEWNKSKISLSQLNCLEIGSGMGLLGAVILTLYRDQFLSLTLTETNPVFQRLDQTFNALLTPTDREKCQVKFLDWSQISEIETSFPHFYHLILASDVIVFPQQVSILLNLLTHFLSRREGTDKPIPACLLGVVSYREPFNAFFIGARDLGIQIEQIGGIPMMSSTERSEDSFPPQRDCFPIDGLEIHPNFSSETILIFKLTLPS